MMLARTAERFGQRPSAMVGLRGPLLALELDEALAYRLIKADAAARMEARQQRRRGAPSGTKPPGLRYQDLDRAYAAEVSARRAVH